MSGAVLAVYVRAMGGWLRFSVLIAWFLATEAARVAATVWLSEWTSNTSDSTSSSHNALWYLAIYAAISLGQVSALDFSHFPFCLYLPLPLPKVSSPPCACVWRFALVHSDLSVHVYS